MVRPSQTKSHVEYKLPPPSHCLWAALFAFNYKVFPLICTMCGGQMHSIAFITFSTDILMILDHIAVEPEAPHA